jgi:NADP-dependent 3-hydroxy acid dehydrogenase YdfG
VCNINSFPSTPSPRIYLYHHYNTMAQTPVWFITAATSGFGKGIALTALARGHKVLATGRSLSRLADLKEAGADVYELDVTSKLDTLKQTVKEAHSKYGRIDYLVNAAGYILVGAVEECRYFPLRFVNWRIESRLTCKTPVQSRGEL